MGFSKYDIIVRNKTIIIKIGFGGNYPSVLSPHMSDLLPNFGNFLVNKESLILDHSPLIHKYISVGGTEQYLHH